MTVLGHVLDNKLYHLGGQYGLSIVLPSTEENIELIQRGPKALREAAEYYAAAESTAEVNAVIANFHAGARYLKPSFSYLEANRSLDLVAKRLS